MLKLKRARNYSTIIKQMALRFVFELAPDINSPATSIHSFELRRAALNGPDDDHERTEQLKRAEGEVVEFVNTHIGQCIRANYAFTNINGRVCFETNIAVDENYSIDETHPATDGARQLLTEKKFMLIICAAITLLDSGCINVFSDMLSAAGIETHVGSNGAAVYYERIADVGQGMRREVDEDRVVDLCSRTQINMRGLIAALAMKRYRDE